MPCPKPNDKEPYHVTLRKIYTKNRDIIGVLAHWRKVFAIRQDGLDRGVAYVLEKIRQQHSFRWKSYAKRLMKDCLDNPHYMPSMIGYIIYTNQILDIKEELKQMETWEHSKKKEILESGYEYTEKLVVKFEKALKEGEKRIVHGIQDEYMPEWYYVSGNAFSLYQEDWIAPYQNRMISKEHNLFEQEKQILEIYQTQRVAMWQDFFDQQITPILVTLQNLLTKKKQCCTTSPTLTIMEQHHYLLMQYIKEQKENIDLLSSLINQNKMLIPNTSIRDTFTRQHKRYYELLQEQMKLM